MLRRCVLADTSANEMARSRSALVPHLVRYSYSIALYVKVHMYQEYHLLTLGSQRTKKTFRTWLRYLFLFIKKLIAARDELVLSLAFFNLTQRNLT